MGLTRQQMELRAALDEIGLTKTQLAKAMGVKYDTFAAWFYHGQRAHGRKMPAVACRLLEVLRAHPEIARNLAGVE